jgi:hypothetical protein
MICLADVDLMLSANRRVSSHWVEAVDNSGF